MFKVHPSLGSDHVLTHTYVEIFGVSTGLDKWYAVRYYRHSAKLRGCGKDDPRET